MAQSENYGKYIKALRILAYMVDGYRITGIKPVAADATCLQEIINFAVAGENGGIPKYIQTFIHHFLIKKTHITINLGDWDHHFIEENVARQRFYGYKKLAKLFQNIGYGTINFDLLLKLLPNTKVFTVINVESPIKANKSMTLSDDFAMKMLECIDYLNGSSVSLSFSRFEIVKPASSTNLFIKNNKNGFQNKGWALKHEYFVGKGVWSNFNSEKMLLIEKVVN